MGHCGTKLSIYPGLPGALAIPRITPPSSCHIPWAADPLTQAFIPLCTIHRMIPASVLPRCFLRLGHNLPRRKYSTSTIPLWLRDNFSLWPTFLNEIEQTVLLRAALRKLDDNESRTMRRRRRDYLAAHQEATPRSSLGTPITNVFLPDEYYHFEEVRGFASHITALFY